MAFVACFASLGLLFMEIRLALTLSIITGLLDFNPYIDPLVATVPVVLLAINCALQIRHSRF